MLGFYQFVYVLLSIFSCTDTVESEVTNEDRPTVILTNGPIMGRKFISSWTNEIVYAFTGIPYAKPPIGDLRFKDPTLPQNWTKVLNCTVEAPWCVQTPMMGETPSTISEDCLYLNVYSPQIDVTLGALLPVMVWVHGGGWTAGSGSYVLYGPDMLLAEGVVVVTLNYRLGAFGFLSLGIPEAPGNAGQKDQILALKWVQKEIEKFGGDPTRVTLAGESAASHSVHLHYLSPLSKGLFHRVIAESGTALVNCAREDHAPYGLKLAALLNCSTADSTSALVCLLSASADDILTYQSKVPVKLEDSVDGDYLVWRTNVDKTLSSEPFLPAMPLELYEQGQGSFVPILMGTNRDEGNLKLQSTEAYIENITNNLAYLIPKRVREMDSEEEIHRKTQDIEKFYFNGRTPSRSYITGFLNLYTDVLMAYPTSVSARLYRSRSTVYLYQFVYDGKFKEPWSFKMEERYNMSLVGHAEELYYLFAVKKVNQTIKDSEEITTWRRMVRLWTNFIKYGTPTTSLPDSLLQDVIWYPVSNTTSRYLNIDKNLTMVDSDYIGARAELWDSVYDVSSSSSYLQNRLIFSVFWFVWFLV